MNNYVLKQIHGLKKIISIFEMVINYQSNGNRQAFLCHAIQDIIQGLTQANNLLIPSLQLFSVIFKMYDSFHLIN